jgi:hypothetical protein
MTSGAYSMLKQAGRSVRRLGLHLLIAAVFATTACGGSTSNPSAPSGSGTPNPPAPAGTHRGTMSATVDGTRWDAVVISAAAIQGGVLRIAGQDGLTTPFVALGVAVPPAVGTYTVSAATGATVAGSLDQTSNSDPKLLQWNANFTFGSGTITLSTLTATGASGTFSFTLVHISTPSTGTRVITNGVFNVTF